MVKVSLEKTNIIIVVNTHIKFHVIGKIEFTSYKI